MLMFKIDKIKSQILVYNIKKKETISRFYYVDFFFLIITSD
jgi:hypothetical protein